MQWNSFYALIIALAAGGIAAWAAMAIKIMKGDVNAAATGDESARKEWFQLALKARNWGLAAGLAIGIGFAIYYAINPASPFFTFERVAIIGLTGFIGGFLVAGNAFDPGIFFELPKKRPRD